MLQHNGEKRRDEKIIFFYHHSIYYKDKVQEKKGRLFERGGNDMGLYSPSPLEVLFHLENLVTKSQDSIFLRFLQIVYLLF